MNKWKLTRQRRNAVVSKMVKNPIYTDHITDDELLERFEETRPSTSLDSVRFKSRRLKAD